MKKASILIFLGLLAVAGCNNQPAQQQQASAPNSPPKTASANTTGVQRSSDSLTVSSHGTEKGATTGNSNSSGAPASTGGSSPMQRGVDVTEMTAAIEKADKAYKAKPDDAKLKDELAEAYFKRAFVLTDAAQYRAALGDFRKGLKLKPDNQEAKSMHDQIIDIFRSIGREPPKEGEEPPPAPIDKKS